jgi:hypothetical protein
MGDDLDTIIMGSTRCELQSLLGAMMGDSTEEFYKALDGEGRINLLSPRRQSTGASPAPATTISRPESTPTARALANILSWQAIPRPDTELPHLARAHSSEGETSTSLHTSTLCRAGGSTTTERASRWTSSDHSLPACTAVA